MTNNFEYPIELLQLFLILKPYSENTFLVGGCVRDMCLNKTPKDFDLVTDINLDVISQELKNNDWKIDEAGKQFLVLIASKNGHQFEIALYRKDLTYSDGRRPDSVDIGNINDDAIRRDFTINSLYYNPYNHQIIDPTNKGLKDINNKILRFNGKAKDRIIEDYIRIFRLYRFAKSLNFTIEPKALKAARTYFEVACKSLAAERIRVEIEKF